MFCFDSPKRSSQTKHRDSERRSRFAAALEPLEGRRLMSCGVDGGVLWVNGTDANDTVGINAGGPTTTVTQNGVTCGSYASASFSSIRVYTYGGNDYINITSPAYVPATINAGSGNDTVYGGNGPSTVDAGDGHDRLYGGASNDYFDGWTGQDYIHGGGGNDTLLGYTGNDTLAGYTGNDTLYPEADNDLVWGGSGNDTAYGDAGSDTLYGDDGDDYLVGDNFTGATGNDLIKGGIGNDIMHGNGGDDTLYGDAGNDYLAGSDGDDGIFGGLHGDTDTLSGGSGDDRFLVFRSGGSWQDIITDRTSSDARLGFKDGEAVTISLPSGSTASFAAGAWTNREVEVVDGSLALMHRMTGNTRLLKRPGGDEIMFIRHGVSTSGVNAWNQDWNDEIHFAQSTFTNATGAFTDDNARRIVLHEVGHNWEDEGNWSAWKDISGWTDRDMSGSSWYTRKSTSTNWWYLVGTGFVSDYARTNPYEDFAETFAAYFASMAGWPSGYGSIPLAKLNFVRSMVSDLTT